MIKPICEEYGVTAMDVLTGFKYIGEKIKQFEKDSSYTYLFGFEESYGYLSGTHARDKDGVNASMLIAEITAYYKSRGMTLFDAMNELYEKYGYFKESVLSATFEGLDGMEKIKALMNTFKENPPLAIDGTKIEEIINYNNGIDGLPKADVLRFELCDETTIFILSAPQLPTKGGDGDLVYIMLIYITIIAYGSFPDKSSMIGQVNSIASGVSRNF